MRISVVSPDAVNDGWSHLCDSPPTDSSILINFMIAIDDSNPIKKLVRKSLWRSMTDEGDHLMADLAGDRCQYTDNEETNIKQFH